MYNIWIEDISVISKVNYGGECYVGKILVLAEKPSVGRDLAKVLNSNQNSNGCMLGNKYIVTWSLGHLVTLADPEVYSDRYKT